MKTKNGKDKKEEVNMLYSNKVSLWKLLQHNFLIVKKLAKSSLCDLIYTRTRGK